MSISKPIIHRIGLPPQLKMLFIERHVEVRDVMQVQVDYDADGPVLDDQEFIKSSAHWLLPISTNPDRTLGIFLKLYDDGKIERVTVREDEGDEIHVIKPADKDIK